MTRPDYRDNGGLSTSCRRQASRQRREVLRRQVLITKRKNSVKTGVQHKWNGDSRTALVPRGPLGVGQLVPVCLHGWSELSQSRAVSTGPLTHPAGTGHTQARRLPASAGTQRWSCPTVQAQSPTQASSRGLGCLVPAGKGCPGSARLAPESHQRQRLCHGRQS